MKRFFSRFSTVPSPSPTKPVQDARFDCSEKKDLDAVAPAPALPAPYNHLGRTKALVAKFEGASLSQSASLSPSDTTPDITPDRFPPTIPIEQTGPPVLNTAANPSRSILPSDVVASVPKRLPGSSLPAESGRQSDLVALDTPETKTPRCPDQGTHQRQSSSCPQAGPSATHLSKSVAFAPSPQKQRSLSPVPVAQPQRSATSQPLLRTSSSDSSDPNAASSNFARPTAASQARSRTWTRSAASDVSQRIASPNSHTSRDKAPLSFARSARPSQASSTRFTSRRSHSYSSAPSADGNPSASGLTSSLAVKRLASSARRDSMEAASSNPSESPNLGAGPADVSSGPLHFPSRTSLSMRFSYSGSASSRPQSRRNSVDPASPITTNETVAFPPSAFAARSYGFPTWSEMTQEELVRNLGPRERTRQEVLWEIVASEERYLAELEKAKEIYIDALLHPHLFDPERVLPPAPSTLTAFPIDEPGPRNSAASKPQLVPMLPANSNGEPSAFAAGSLPNTHGDLPIASRFMSNISVEKSAAFESIGRGTQPHNAARSPYLGHMGSASTTDNVSSRSGPVTMRVHASFGLGLGLGTTATRDRSTAGYMNVTTTTRAKGKLSKAQKLRGLSRKAKADADADPLRLSVPLPPSLREVLVAMSDVLVEAHGMLSDALKARYEEQWPLVRSLADIFTKYAHIFQRYATYVCHLQRAMEELEEAALMERAFRGKRLKKERLSNTVGLGRTVAALEACAAEQGYAGLSIFASMPFQRLLKYPLLFQNLLFHTDPSTTEFESTVSMVVDIERLVRSIEDEKVNAEERDKMLDCFARIDGITDHQVLRPRPDRVLIEEQALYDQNARRALSESAPKGARADAYPSDSENGESGAENTEPSGGRWSNSNQSGLRAALRNKRSYRRLSDFLPSEDAGHGSSKAPSMGSKKDLWIVRFSDVEIKCQRIGVTALPMVSTAALRIADSSAELDARDFAARTKDSRERLKALRNTTLRAKTRNLYKFISVVAWRNAAARQAGIGKEDSVGGLPTSHEVDEQDSVEGEEEDEASVDSDDGSSVSSSSSSGSDDGIGGQAASQKYVRSTKLSFTYWGDRIEPSRGIAGAQAGAHANDPPKISSGHISNQRNDGPVSRTTGPRLTASADSAGTSAAGAAPTFDSTRSSRQPQTSTLDGASLNLSQIHGRRGVLGRLSEPMAATSMSIAPEPMQNAVAQMHARQRNEKFGARLRSSIANGADDSHVSVDLAGVDAGGVSRAGNRTSLAASGPRAI